MKCDSNFDCSTLQYCLNGFCAHEPLIHLSIHELVAAFALPILAALNNKVGLTSTWLVYPVLVCIMAYAPKQVHPRSTQTFGLISPCVMAANLVFIVLVISKKSGVNTGPAVNYYIVNTTLPVLVVSYSLGLALNKMLPYIFIFILGFLLCIAFTIFYLLQYKQTTADEKIAMGHLRRMLPSRLQTPKKKKNVEIQMALIEEEDSEYDAEERHQTPSHKQYVRTKLLEELSKNIPFSHLFVSLLCFVIYECFCLSIPQIIRWAGVRSGLLQLFVSYSILLAIVVVGELYLYKFYVEPKKIQQEQIKLNLGLLLTGDKMLKLCLLGFIGGLLEGIIGLGFSQIINIYLFRTKMNVNDVIATCGFFSFYIGLCLTLNSIFCGNFEWVSYLVLFVVFLGAISLFQYLINKMVQKHVEAITEGSFLMMTLTIIQIGCAISIAASAGLTVYNFGPDSIFQMESGDLC